MIAKACTCGGVIRGNVCDRCGPKRRKENRGNSTQRGYDWTWRKFRKRYLQCYPLCSDCDEHGMVTPATDVHHIHKLADFPELKYELTNLLPLCKPCHDKRTRRGE